MDVKSVQTKIWGIVAVLLWGCGSDSAPAPEGAPSRSSTDHASLGSFAALPEIAQSKEVRFQIERKIDGVFLAPLVLTKTLEGNDANGIFFREVYSDLESGDVKRDSSRSEPSDRSVAWEQVTEATIQTLCFRVGGTVVSFASAYGVIPACRTQLSETVDGQPGVTTQWLTRVRFGLLEKHWSSENKTRSMRQSLFWAGSKGKF